jgi:hypothetical protein
MLAVAIYIKDVQTGLFNRVDLFDDEKISVVSSIQNINDISKTFTDFSQTFTVPASKQNNKIFRHWYDNTNDEPFRTLVKADAYIEIDTIPFRKGKIQLESANVEDGQAKDYSITFIGLLGNLKDTFAGLYLKDLTSTTYDFEYSASDVLSRITTATSSDVMFPLITSDHYWTFGSGEWNINFEETPIRYNELFPALRLRAVLNMIEERFGINFDGTTAEPSTFLTDPRFLNAYLWLKNRDDAFEANLFQQIDFTTKGNLEELPGVEVNLTDNYFIRNNGGRTIITITPQAGFTTVPYTVYRYLNGEVWDTYNTPSGGTKLFAVRTDADSNKHSFYIRTSQSFEFVFRIDMATYSSGYTKSATMSAQTLSSNVSIRSYFPEIKIEDFFSGILKMFNLTCFSNDGINYTLKTIDNYYDDGSDVDITKYVIQDKKTLNRVKTHKKINFDYEKSESIINVGFNSTNGIEYGSLHYSNTPPAEGEEYSIKLPFENLNFQNLWPNNVLQVGYALKTDLQRYIPKPVILYDYNPTALTVTTGIGFWFSTSLTGNGIEYNAYKAFGQETLIGTETYGLNFNEQQSTLTNEIVNNGLYQTYYSQYFANIFNYKARLTKISAILPTSILTTLKLNDTILIRDTKYLINTMTTDLTSGVAQFELLTDQRVVEPLPIITENLVLNLDAGNPLSYPGTGTTWTDLTTNGNNGTLINGPTFDSANGGSIVFDGTNDYINLGNILNFERTDEFSISTWINVSSLTNYGMILCKMDINQKGYFLYFEPTGAIGFCLRNTFNTNEILTFTQNTISLNNWVNICVTYNGNSLASGVIFYLNNINQTNTVSKDLLSASIINTSNNSIGSRINFNNGYVNGKISIVTVYNKELSATEVLQNFNATKNRYGL